MQQNTNEQLTNPFASLESDITKEALAQAKETFSQGVVRVKTSLSDKLSQLSSVGASLDSFITSLDSALETASNSEEEGVLTEAKEDLEKKAALIISVVGILEKININDVNIIEVLGEINTAAEVADEQTLSLTPEQQKVLINDILDKTAQELSISQKTLKKFKQTKLGLYHTDKHDQKHAVVQDFYAEVFKELEAGILNTYITFFTDNAEYSNEGENKKFIVNAFATEKFYQDNVEIVTAINNKDLEDQERSEAVEKLKTAIRNYTGETLIFLGEDAQDKEKSVLIGVDKQAYIQFLNGNTNVDTKNLGIGKTVLSPLLEAVKAAMVYRPAVVTNPSTEPNVNLDLASMFEGVDFDNLGEGQDSDDKSPSDNELENTSAPDIDVQTNTPQPNQPQPTQANQTQPTTDSVSLNPEQVQASTGTTPPVVDQVQPSTDQEGADQGPQPSQEQLAQQEAERHKTAMLEVYKLFFDRKTEKEIKENILRAGASHFTTIDLEDDKNKIVDDVYNTLCLMAEREKRRFVEQYIAEKFAQEEGKKGSLRKKAENLFSGNWKGVPNFLKPLLSGKTYGLMFAAGYVAEAGKKYISSSAGMSAILAGVYSLAEEGLISHNNKKITQYTNTAESALDVANFDMVSQDSTRDVQLATVFGTTKFYNDEFYPVTAHGIQLGAIKAAYDEEQDGEKRKKLILEHLRIVNEQELGDKFAEATTRYKTKKQGLASVRRYVRNFGTIYAISAFAGCGLFKRASIRFVTKGAIAGVETVLEGVKEKEVLTREEQLRKLLISGSIDDEVVREWLGKVDTKGVGFGDLAKRTGRTMLSQGLAAAGYGEAFNVGMQGAQGNFALASWYDGMGAVNEHAVGESEKTQQSQSRKQEANSEDKSNEGAQPKTTEPQPVAYKEARTVDGKPTTWNTEYASQYNVTHPTTEMVGEIDINGDGNKEAVTLMSETEARSGDGESRMLTRLVKAHNLFEGDEAKIHQWKAEQLERLGIRYEAETLPSGETSTKVIRSTVIHTGLKMQLFVDGSGNPHVQYATGGNDSLITVSKHQHEYGVRDGKYVDLAQHAKAEVAEYNKDVAEQQAVIEKTNAALKSVQEYGRREITGMQVKPEAFEAFINKNVIPALADPEASYKLNTNDGEDVKTAIDREVRRYKDMLSFSKTVNVNSMEVKSGQISGLTKYLSDLDTSPAKDIPISTTEGQFADFKERVGEVSQQDASAQDKDTPINEPEVQDTKDQIPQQETANSTQQSAQELIRSFFTSQENAPKVVGGGAEKYINPGTLGFAENNPAKIQAYEFDGVPRTSGEFIISKDGSAVRVLIDGEQKIIVEKNVVFSKNIDNALTMDVGSGQTLVIDGLSVDDSGVVTYGPSNSSTSGRSAAPFTSDQLSQLNPASST